MANSNKSKVDVVVVGGGMVGSATALGVAQLGLKVALIEKHRPKQFKSSQKPDLRVSAISLASKNVLSSLGVWSELTKMRLHPYSGIEVWEDDGHCKFNAQQIRQSELGYFVENRLIQLAALKQLSKLDNALQFSGEAIESIGFVSPNTFVLDNGDEVECDWIIAADGAQSLTREQVGIKTQGWKYAQQVLAASVKMEGDVGDVSWQQFSPQGPMALLPMYDNFASLVWYNSAAEIARLKQLELPDLKQSIVEAFPDRLGDFSILDRASFPISRLHAERYWKDDVLLIGDAAHCINPLAGQGVNMGFKDLSILLDLLKSNSCDDVASRQDIFKMYQRRRRYDNLLMMSAMDLFYYTFSNNITPLKKLRNLGLSVANNIPPLKNQALRYAVGYW